MHVDMYLSTLTLYNLSKKSIEPLPSHRRVCEQCLRQTFRCLFSDPIAICQCIAKTLTLAILLGNHIHQYVFSDPTKPCQNFIDRIFAILSSFNAFATCQHISIKRSCHPFVCPQYLSMTVSKAYWLTNKPTVQRCKNIFVQGVVMHRYHTCPPNIRYCGPIRDAIFAHIVRWSLKNAIPPVVSGSCAVRYFGEP